MYLVICLKLNKFKDFQTTNEPHHVAALYPKSDESVIKSRYNVDFVVNYWIYKGLLKENLILGLTLQGSNFLLKQTNHLKKAIKNKTL